MANPEHVAMLRQGATAWNSWREKRIQGYAEELIAGRKGSRQLDLQAKLRGADLRKANLRSVDLRGADLSRADLRETMLQGANLMRADLRGAKLHGAYLSRATSAKQTCRKHALMAHSWAGLT